MQDTEKKIIENLTALIPKLNEEQKLFLLGFGEGMAVMVKQDEEKQEVAAV